MNEIIIMVKSNRARGIYTIEISQEMMPDFQRALIKGMEDDTVVFFKVEDTK